MGTQGDCLLNQPTARGCYIKAMRDSWNNILLQ
jgi:hypothetical protein